jgi:quinol monooxygenase YgiN
VHGTEVSFRLGPGTLDEAREIAGRLAAAARGCRRHILFVDAAAGEYGCLAEWDREEDAAGFADRPETRAALAALEARIARRPRVRVYAMEVTGAAPGGD